MVLGLSCLFEGESEGSGAERRGVQVERVEGWLGCWLSRATNADLKRNDRPQ